MKATVRYHLVPVRMAIVKENTANVGEVLEKRGPLCTVVNCRECKLVQPLWRTVWRFLKKLKIELPYDPAIPLLGIYPRKEKNG